MNVSTTTHKTQEQSTSVHARNAIHAFRGSGINFADLIQQKTKELKFSAHAQTRMKSRNISLTEEMVEKLDHAVNSAEKKGAKDTLILLSDLAFIVNVPNKTVVTAMEGDSVRDNIFTNIDSTVVAG